MVIDLIDVDLKLAGAKIGRAKKVAEAYQACETVKDLYTLVQPPPPTIEKTNKGVYVLDNENKIKLTIPPSVSFPDHSYKLYWGKTRWGKARRYVEDYKYPKEFLANKPDPYQMAVYYDNNR